MLCPRVVSERDAIRSCVRNLCTVSHPWELEDEEGLACPSGERTDSSQTGEGDTGGGDTGEGRPTLPGV